MSEEVVTSQDQLESDKKLREQLLLSMKNGLQTEIEPRAYSHEEILEIVNRLQLLGEKEYNEKLIIAGFTPNPFVFEDDEQACETCMYYRVHQEFCELPELMLPVKEEWSCRLWRI